MRRVEVEAYSEAVNTWVIRTPGRQYPAAVVQGDSLNLLLELAQSMVARARACSCADAELVGEAEELRDLLGARVHHYEQVLSENEIELPYPRAGGPG